MKSKLGDLPDVLVLQEVTAYASAISIAETLGDTSGTVITSDAGRDGETWPLALEVAVISKVPVRDHAVFQMWGFRKRKPFVYDLATTCPYKG